MTEPLRAVCPQCGTRYLIQPTALGKKIVCQKCNAPFTPSNPEVERKMAGQAPAAPPRTGAQRTFTVLGKLIALGAIGFAGYLEVPNSIERTRIDVKTAESRELAADYEEELDKLGEDEGSVSAEDRNKKRADLEKKHEEETSEISTDIANRDTDLDLVSRMRTERTLLARGALLLGLLLVALAGTRPERFGALAAVLFLVV